MANTVDQPVGEREPIGVDPRRTWLERVALLLVVAAVGQIARYTLQGLAYATASRSEGVDGGFEWTQFLAVVSVAGDSLVGVLLAVALGLVVLAPGHPGRLAVVVANAVSVVGVVVAALAVLAIEEVFRSQPGVYDPFGDTDRDAVRFFQGSAVLGYGAAFALALGTAYAAWRLLRGGFGLPAADLGPFAPADRPDDARSGEPSPAGPPSDPGTPVDDDAWSPRPPAAP